MGATGKFANVAASGVAAPVVDDLVSETPGPCGGGDPWPAEALSGQPPASSYASGEIIRFYPSRVFTWGLGPEHPGIDGRPVAAVQSDQP